MPLSAIQISDMLLDAQDMPMLPWLIMAHPSAQVDFSQSVHHLWKQYRRHGKAGGAEELAAANEQGEQERGGPQGGPRGALLGGLQLKPGAGGLYAGPAG